MRRFAESEIYSVDIEPIVGGRLGDWLQQLMQNQNEMMELLVGPTIFHNQRIDSGLGPLTEKGELSPSAIIRPQVKKRVFSAWRTDRPSGFGFLISRYNIKVYLFRWTFGIGWIPEEVVWERQEKKLNPEQSSDAVQNAIT